MAYDPVRRRKGVRKGRETGVWIYVPGEELAKVGYSKDDPPPFYRVWTRSKTLLIGLYREA